MNSSLHSSSHPRFALPCHANNIVYLDVDNQRNTPQDGKASNSTVVPLQDTHTFKEAQRRKDDDVVLPGKPQKQLQLADM